MFKYVRAVCSKPRGFEQHVDVGPDEPHQSRVVETNASPLLEDPAPFSAVSTVRVPAHRVQPTRLSSADHHLCVARRAGTAPSLLGVVLRAGANEEVARLEDDVPSPYIVDMDL
jgi:hypothetical protein